MALELHITPREDGKQVAQGLVTCTATDRSVFDPAEDGAEEQGSPSLHRGLQSLGAEGIWSRGRQGWWGRGGPGNRGEVESPYKQKLNSQVPVMSCKTRTPPLPSLEEDKALTVSSEALDVGRRNKERAQPKGKAENKENMRKSPR